MILFITIQRKVRIPDELLYLYICLRTAGNISGAAADRHRTLRKLNFGNPGEPLASPPVKFLLRYILHQNEKLISSIPETAVSRKRLPQIFRNSGKYLIPYLMTECIIYFFKMINIRHHNRNMTSRYRLKF